MDLRQLVRTQGDRVAALGCALLGGLALLLGWIGVSGTALGYEQLPYLISGGVLGALLIGVGATLYLSADLRDEWRKLDTLEESLRQAVALLEVAQAVVPEPVVADTPAATTPRISTPRQRAPRRTAVSS